MQLDEIQRYVDYNVYNVTKIKNKYGFRIKLIYSDGREIFQQKSGYASMRIANKERDKMVAELASGKYVVKEKIYVKDFFIHWLEEEIKPRVTESTYRAYKNSIYYHIVPRIGNIAINLLNCGHIQEFYEDESKKSHSSLRMAKAVMDSAMKYALNKQMIVINPTIGVRLPKSLPKKEYRKLNINVQKTLSIEQLKVLINAAKGTSIYLQVLFSSLMGLRISEVNGLKYSDIDFVSRKLKVDRQLGIKANSKKEDFDVKTYTKQEIPVKTKSSNRELEIPDILFEAILEERKKYENNKKRRKNDKSNPFQDLGYICCSSYGRPRGRTYAFELFKKLLKENNLPNIRWHDLRATYATILIKKDFSLKAISKKMGHAKQIITADVYVDKNAIVEDCLEYLNPFLEEVLPKNQEPVLKDYTKESEVILVDIEDLIQELTTDINEVNDCTKESEDVVSILNLFWATI